jgi:uncharacterized membrane protein YeiH
MKIYTIMSILASLILLTVATILFNEPWMYWATGALGLVVYSATGLVETYARKDNDVRHDDRGDRRTRPTHL